MCVHEMVSMQASLHPEALAIVTPTGSLSYGELARRARTLLQHLRSFGVGPETVVGLCMERSPDQIIGALAILMAGGAYLPVDPDNPTQRLRLMFSDARVPMVLAEDHVVDRISSGSWQVLVPSEMQLDGVHETSPVDVLDRVKPDHLAYVIYTSGSTGIPKGVAVTHRSLLNLVRWHQRAFHLTSTDRAAYMSGLGFDASIWELWPYLAAGASVCLPPESIRNVPDLLRDWLIEQEITMSFAATQMAERLTDLSWPPNVALRLLLTGADTLHRFPPTNLPFGLVNNYGPTECTVVATSGLVPSRTSTSELPTIGRPISNTRVYILDENLTQVSNGTPGELFVGGAALARGYLNRPELTAQRFMPDPFAPKADGRMYRTGDLARVLPDGNIEFLGRNDYQVKIRGFRIELGEIEARLAEHAGVKEVVVILREDRPGEKRLVAYYTGKEGEEVSAEELRGYIANRLPEYMVPAAYVRLEAMPLMANGKLDRRGLPEPGAEAYVVREYEAPQGETEELLAGIWAELLGVQRVGRSDNFFELGGHSLLALRVIARIRQRLETEVAISDLFAHPELKGLAARVLGASKAELPPVKSAERGDTAPLSFAQQRLWFLAQMEGVSGVYHMRLWFHLKGELDRHVLRQALDSLTRRHEVLRTRFEVRDEQPIQRIAGVEASHFDLIEHDLRGTSNAWPALDALMREEASREFDLERGPVIRGQLIQETEDEHTLLITMHHIVSDGWSTSVFLKELSELYRAYRQGEEPTLPELNLQYADYALWQRRWIEGEVLQKQVEYWERELAGVPELLELPWDHTRPGRQDFSGDGIPVEFGERLTVKLKDLSRRHGATLFMTLLAGWSALLSGLSGQQNVLTGTPVANRGRAEIEQLIGFFVNTQVLRVDVSGSPTIAELLERVKKLAIEAQRHQDIPFEQIVEIINPARSLDHSPLFQVMFVWQNAPRSRLELAGLEVQPVTAGGGRKAKFDLTLTLWEEGGKIVGDLEYATSLFERATIQRYEGYMKQLLESMVIDESQKVDSLLLLSAIERQRVLSDFVPGLQSL